MWGVLDCCGRFACLTSAPLVSAVFMLSLQVEEAVRDVLVAVVFSLLDHLVLWTKTKPRC